MHSKSPVRGAKDQSKADGPGLLGKHLPLGIDKNSITEEEINNFLKITSENSLKEIAKQTEILAGESMKGGRMIRGSEKMTLEEVQSFMQQVSANGVCKLNKKDLREYLSAFPQRQATGKNDEQKVKKSEINFLMNGKNEIEATELYELLKETQIEEFDAVEEAFSLLDVQGQEYLTVDTFK